MTLLDSQPEQHNQPLAMQLRPQQVRDFSGQQHLLAAGKPLRVALETGSLHSMILWGPPGTGKTTLALLMAASGNARLEKLSAVLAGVKEIRAAVASAQDLLATEKRKTVLFVDEVHRFNKSQQDAFLPFVENGTVIFIGATTENPSFALNNALLSRARVYVLQRLTDQDLLAIIQRCLQQLSETIGKAIEFPQNLRLQLVQRSDGDARACINGMEIAVQLADMCGEPLVINQEILQQVISDGVRRFDKQGEDFYDQISALHKAVRGSAPDPALYWFARMVDGGCDLAYLARRIIRMASEDIGNADPRGLEIALNAWQAYERLGSPEGELALAQAVAYLAVAPKSNAVYTAFNQAMADVKQYGSLPVPLHLRNAPTRLMRNLGYGKAYRYAHDEAGAYAAGENYFPQEFPKKQYYHPVDRGLEQKIKQKLDALRAMDRAKG